MGYLTLHLKKYIFISAFLFILFVIWKDLNITFYFFIFVSAFLLMLLVIWKDCVFTI